MLLLKGYIDHLIILQDNEVITKELTQTEVA